MPFSKDDFFLNGLINSLDAPVFVKDREHRWLFLNDSMCRMIGVPREKLIGRSDYDFFPKDQADVFWAMDEAVFTSGEVNENEEFFTDSAGEVHSIITRKSLFYLPDNRPILVGFIIDVTKQRRAEKSLNEKKEWLALAVEGADLGLWDWWIKADRVVYNPRWLTMLDYRPEDMADATFSAVFELLHLDDRDRVNRMLKDCLEGTREVFSIEFRLRKRKGDYCWILSRGRVVERDDTGAPIRMAGTHLDIDLAKRREEELQHKLDELKAARERLEFQTGELIQARQFAERASQSKGEFLAVMSHEIRTPMTGVLGIAELLKDGDLNVDQRELVENIIFSGRILLTVINDVLDFSKIEAQKIELFTRPFDIHALVGGLEGALANYARSAGVQLSMVIDPVVPRWIIGDSARLQQVLTNLIANSIKFTPAGGNVLLDISAQEQGTSKWMFNFDVFDSGVGISEQDQARILRPFEQAYSSSVETRGGTGLGLAISNRLIQMMGGELTIRSKLGAGSTFCFSLLFEDMATRENLPSVDVSPAPRPMRALKILVAEDNRVNQMLIERLLVRAGHSVEIVENGELAIAAARSERYDVLLMDIQMPVLDGEKAARLMKDDPALKSLPIIALTAHALNSERDTYLAAGMDGFVSKPINRILLFEELERVVARAQREPCCQGAVGSPAASKSPPQKMGEPSGAAKIAADPAGE